MTHTSPPYQRAVATAAEQQMRRWAMRRETEQRIEREEEQRGETLAPPLFPYLALSRETGVGSEEIARQVGEQLDWDVLDKQLLDYMAETYHLPRVLLDFVDETRSSWLLEIFGKWIDRCVVTQSEYVTHLGQIVLVTAHHGSAVFVGRGAQFFLPAEAGLRVRVVAPLEMRVARIARRDRLEVAAARRLIARTDEARHDFVQRYFHHDVEDPHLYDLVVNLANLDAEEVARLIAEECRRKFGRPAQPR